MRTELPYNEGLMWHRKGTDFYFSNATLGEWDSVNNYEQVTIEQYSHDTEEISDSEALSIITSQDNEL